MRLCAAGFTSSQRNPRYCESVVGRSIVTDGSSRVLLELPEKTLPELDATLVAALQGNKPRVDVLVARYASDAVAPQLKAWVEQVPGRLCNDPALPAYFFRVDPDWTSTMMARVRQNSRGVCRVNLGSIEDLLMSPGLEKQAIADLSSSNLMIVRSAETLLERGGSAAAEKPLLEAFARFTRPAPTLLTRCTVASTRDSYTLC